MVKVHVYQVNEIYDDRYEVIGEPKYKFYVEAEGRIENVLIDYLSELKNLPIYLTVTTYDNYQDLEALLIKLKQEYKIHFLADTVYTTTGSGGTLKYHVPMVKIKITNFDALEKIINDTFWMAESNCTYLISFSDNIRFKNEMGKDLFGKPVEFSTFLIDMDVNTVAIGITHDAHGFYLFSNLDEQNSIDTIAKQLTNHIIIFEEEDGF